MDELLTGNIWAQIEPLAKRSRRRAAALAYVSRSDLIAFNSGDVLVCDASNKAIKSGETSAGALQDLFNRGVIIYSNPNLHAKVMVMGTHALIGSANLSAQSTQPFREASYLTTRTTAVSQSKAYIHRVMCNATSIDEAFINRIRRIKVNRRTGNRAISEDKERLLGSRFWIVRVDEYARDVHGQEEQYVQRAERMIRKESDDPEVEPTWIRCAGSDTTTFRKEARAGDILIQLSAPANSNRVTVYEPTAILFRQDGKGWTRFYVADHEFLESVSWTEFNRRLRRAGISYIRKTSCREIKPNDVDLLEAILAK